MRPKSALQKIKPLLSATSFTSAEARARGVSSATIAHYVKSGEITRIGHGVYKGCARPFEDFRWEDLVEAQQRTRGGVVCLVSALAIYDLTEEIPRRHWIALRNETIHRHPRSTKVIRMRNTELGKTTTKISGAVVPIFNRERTIVDSFRYLSKEVAIKALKEGLKKRGNEKISIELLLEYGRKLRVKIQPYLLAVTT